MCDDCDDTSAHHPATSVGRTQSGSPRGGDVSRRCVVKAGAGLAIGAAMSAAIWQAKAEAQTVSGNARTLIIASHPYPERSVVNKALWEVAQKPRVRNSRIPNRLRRQPARL